MSVLSTTTFLTLLRIAALIVLSVPIILVFTASTYQADNVANKLRKNGIVARAIHRKNSQQSRKNALQDFKDGRLRVLVATDLLSRGIDIEDLPYVINYELPRSPKDYIHRIGRTGRAGLGGYAISFCSQDQYDLLLDVQKHIKMKIPVMISSMHSIEITKASPKMKSKLT